MPKPIGVLVVEVIEAKDLPRYQYCKHFCSLAVVVAQLVEQSLPTPEIRRLNPVIGKIYILNICFLSTVLKWPIKNIFVVTPNVPKTQ